MIYGEITHFSHPRHVLKLAHQETPYTCNGCGEIGFYSSYKCDDASCNFHLHKDCASATPTITHPFFPNCVFKFLEHGKPNRYCDACGGDINGFVYHCFNKGWDLHPSCAMLPHVMEEGEMKLVLRRKVSSKCYKCGEKGLKNGGKSWSYVSTCKECHLHVACVKEMLLENWEREHLRSSEGNGMSLVRREPKLQIVLEKSKRKTGKFAMVKRIVKLAIAFIMAAVVGDPSTLVAGVIVALFSH